MWYYLDINKYTKKETFIYEKGIFVNSSCFISSINFVGCSSKSSNGNSTSNNSGFKIGVVTDEGGAKDKSFNQSNVEAVKDWVQKMVVKHLNPIETKTKVTLQLTLQKRSKSMT